MARPKCNVLPVLSPSQSKNPIKARCNLKRSFCFLAEKSVFPTNFVVDCRMDSSLKFVGAAVTHSESKVKSAQLRRSRMSENWMRSENVDPSVLCSGLNFWSSASIVKSGNGARKSVLRNPNCNQLAYSSPGKEIHQRKCLIEMKNSLRAIHTEIYFSEARERGEGSEEEGAFQNSVILSEENISGNGSLCKNIGEISELGFKRGRDRLSEEVKQSIPEHGSGRVMYLVRAFEKLTIPEPGESEEKEEEEMEDDNKGIRLGLQEPAKISKGEVSSCSSLCPSDLFLTSESLGLRSSRSYSTFGSQGRISSVTSSGGQTGTPRSTKTHGTLNRRQLIGKQQKTTSWKPFMLRTQFLVKPPVKQNTKPIDMVLHTNTRATERAEFNHQVANKMNLIEQHRREKAKQQKLAAEEDIRRLRKELVPKAQPMPYFDKPFIPRRSTRQPTIPREPKFHLPQHKKIKY